MSKLFIIFFYTEGFLSVYLLVQVGDKYGSCHPNAISIASKVAGRMRMNWNHNRDYN